MRRVPVKTLKDLIAHSRKFQLTFASSGVATSSHLAGELPRLNTGMNAVHVPYQGAAPTTAAVMTGEVHFAFANAASSLGLVNGGKLRVIAVSTIKRISIAPQFPTLDELGVRGFDVGSWAGLQAPAGTPVDIVRQLAEITVRVLNTPELRENLPKVGAEAVPLNDVEFAAFLKADVRKWADVTKRAGLKPQ